jgi:hypothetical protein
MHSILVMIVLIFGHKRLFEPTQFQPAIRDTRNTCSQLMSYSSHVSNAFSGASRGTPGSEHDGVDADRATHHQEAKHCRHPEQAVH